MYVLVAIPAWILVEFSVYGLLNGTPPDFARIGPYKYVGTLERWLMTTFVLTGQLVLVPLVAPLVAGNPHRPHRQHPPPTGVCGRTAGQCDAGCGRRFAGAPNPHLLTPTPNGTFTPARLNLPHREATMLSIALTRQPSYNHPMSNPLAARCAFLQNVPLFANLGEAELAALAADMRPHDYTPNALIFSEGEPGQTLFLVERGQVRIFIQNENGQEISVNVCGPGDLFDELAVIDQLPRSATAQAMDETRVLNLNRERFRDHLRRSPQLALNFMQALSVRVRYNTRQMDNLNQRSVPARLARKLLELAQQNGLVENRGVRLRLTLTQSDLASMPNATRESVNKALGQFRRQKLIEMHAGHIIVLDPEGLRAQSA